MAKRESGVKSVAKKRGRPESASAASPEIEARDYVHDAASLRNRLATCMDRINEFRLAAKKLSEELADHIRDGALNKPRSGMLFDSVEEAHQMTQALAVTRLEVGITAMQRIRDSVSDSNLSRVRIGIDDVIQETLKAGEEQEAA